MSSGEVPGGNLRERLRNVSGLVEVMALVNGLENEAGDARAVKIGVSGNVTLDILEVYLRRQALLDGYRATVLPGSYDDHVGNMRRFREAGAEVVVVLNLLDNIAPGLEARLGCPDPDLVKAVADRLRQETLRLLEEGRGVRWVFFCLLHRLSPPSAAGLNDRVDEGLAIFNAILREECEKFPNARVLNPDEIVRELGWREAFSPRFYLRYRAPYQGRFFEKLAHAISVASRACGTHYYKVLVLDADNTLWGGILGEDAPADLKLDPFRYPGNAYWNAQQEFLALQRQGILLAICSKNEESGLRELLASHPQMVLRPEHFVAIRSNWDEKVVNLERIASELNLGLDSFVFVDDSSFEVEAVRRRLPMVRAVQVPMNPYDYPLAIRELKECFLVADVEPESRDKTEQYRRRGLAESERGHYETHAEYLAFLGIKLEIRLGERAARRRIAELTQKSNQFNLTTRRYTEAQIESFMCEPDVDIFSLYVSDRFGDSGLTGVLILRRDGGDAVVDTFLLSCRVLGRGIEFAPWPKVLARQKACGVDTLRAEYIPTPKNGQVRDFFDRMGMTPGPGKVDGAVYEMRLFGRLPAASAGIEVSCGF